MFRCHSHAGPSPTAIGSARPAMIIAEFTIDHPVLGQTLATVSDVEVVWEETYERAEGPPMMLFWVRGDDTGVADALAADEAIRDPTLLAELEDRRLYRVAFTDLGVETNLMPHLMAVGGVLQEAVGTEDGWTCRAQFPDRAALDHIYQFCRGHDVRFTLDKLYDRAAWAGADAAITQKQRTVLKLAYEEGYFKVPKETSLAAIAEELDVTKQAVSARLNRGLDNVLEERFSVDR